LRTSRILTVVDTHAEGNHTRVVTGGVLDVPGCSMFAKMGYLEREADWLRRLLLREPRGYPATSCDIVFPSTDPAALAGFVIMEQAQYPPMSGSNAIGVATVLLETGMVPVRSPVTDFALEAPAGLITVRAETSGSKVNRVTLRNVPSFALHTDVEVDVPTVGAVRVDIAYGGAFFVIADAADFGVELRPEYGATIVRIGELLKAATREQYPVVHPENSGIRGVTLALFSGPASRPDAEYKNAVVVSTGSPGHGIAAAGTGILDRSPCGTGTCAKMAVLHAKGRLGLRQEFCHEGILGTAFRGELLEECEIGPYQGVVPSISGTAYITGIGNVMIDEDDPFPEGYTVGDIWGGI
jgi:proline racemase